MTSSWIVLTLVTLGVLIATNLYWWSRLGTAKESLKTSLEREERLQQASGVGKYRQIAEQASSAADCPPEDLPERIRTLRENLRVEHNRIEKLRERWVDSHLEALNCDPISTGEPQVLVITVEDTIEQANAFAKAAHTHDDWIIICVATDDATFAVGVNESLRDRFTADEIASDLQKRGDGDGSGGNEGFASGNGANSTALEEAAQYLASEIRKTLRS